MTQNDLTIYSRHADEWWVKGAPHFRSLQNITPFRLSLIAELVGDLNGKQVLDLGCGGGLISIPLLQGGAVLTGVDLSKESIEVARIAARGQGKFSVGDVRRLPIDSESFDCVLLVDVLDHIPHFAQALREASRVLRSGGKLFVGTLNRTFLARFLAIRLGEGLGFIPKGTHDFRLFITPAELLDTARLYGLECRGCQGEWPVFLRTISRRAITLKKSKSLSVAYSAVFEKVGYAQ
jgi:2-polyprenyl-6-hydroxyphenyl methylase/3-demethylubiquinone-9 3-methyltransferase